MQLRLASLGALSLLLTACPADAGNDSATGTTTTEATDATATDSPTTSSTDATTTTGEPPTSTTADPSTGTTGTSTGTTTESTTTGTTTESTTTGTTTESTTTGGVEGELGCGPGDQFDFGPYLADDCFCGDACDCYRDVPYGEAANWNEPTLDDLEIHQAVDIYVPKGMSQMPAVLWAHANGSSKTINPGSGLAKSALGPAIDAGQVVVSVEFRHPVTNYDIGAPRTDLVDAVQFIRCNAPTLGVDPEKIAGMASSRGTLMLWTAVQPELADPDSRDPVKRQSSRLLGVYAAQAQTSYWGQWIADTFYAPELHDLLLMQLPADDLALGHAVGDVDADSPRVELVYVHPLAELPITLQTIGMVDPLHLPNFGDELCKAYAAAGHGEDCTVHYEVAQNAIHAGSVAFFAELFGG